MKALGCFGLLVLSLFIFIALIAKKLWHIVRLLFGTDSAANPRRPSFSDPFASAQRHAHQERASDTSGDARAASTDPNTHTGRQKEKIFSPRASEYVEFEEVR